MLSPSYFKMPESRQSSTKKCPHCVEEILADAKKCKHCGEFLDQKRIRNWKGLKPTAFHSIDKISCPECGYEGKPSTVTRGSFAIELILWLCYLLPGLIYSLWRLSTRRYVCRQCGCTEISAVKVPPVKRESIWKRLNDI